MTRVGWLVRASLRRPGKFISVIRGSIRDRFLKISLESNFIGKNIEYSIPPFSRSDVVAQMIIELENEGIKVIKQKIEKDDFEQFLTNADYSRYKYYYDSGRAPILREKAMEHFLAAKFLEISPNDVYIDIANGDSPAPWIYQRLYSCTSFAHDRYFKTSRGNHISGNADNLNVSDSSADKMALHCSFDHFINDYDSKFISEVARVLKPNGKCCIVPLYIYQIPGAVTDPGYVTEWSIFKEFKNIYIDYNFRNDFSRLYDVKTLKQKILSILPNNLTYSIIVIQNMDEVCPECYAKFALIFTKKGSLQHCGGK